MVGGRDERVVAMMDSRRWCCRLFRCDKMRVQTTPRTREYGVKLLDLKPIQAEEEEQNNDFPSLM
jgi:hypothetical protein